MENPVRLQILRLKSSRSGAGGRPLARPSKVPLAEVLAHGENAVVCKTAQVGATPARDSIFISEHWCSETHAGVRPQGPLKLEYWARYPDARPSFPSEAGPPAETSHGRRCWRTATMVQVHGIAPFSVPQKNIEISRAIFTPEREVDRAAQQQEFQISNLRFEI